MENSEARKTEISNDTVLSFTSVIDRILPFTESPSSNQYDGHTKTDGELRACDLFSVFTADIIRSDVIFTR